MKTVFLLAVANGQGAAIVNAIPRLSYSANLMRANRPGLIYEHNGRRLEAVLWRLGRAVSLPEQSTAGDGTWVVYQVTPIDLDPGAGRAVLRKLRRVVLSPTNESGGGYYIHPATPMSIRRAFELWPTWVNNRFRPKKRDGDDWVPDTSKPLCVAHKFLGDGEDEDLAAVDYRPTDQECIDDED